MLKKSKRAHVEYLETAVIGDACLAQAVVAVREESPFKVGGKLSESTVATCFVGAIRETGEAECAFAAGEADFIGFYRDVAAGNRESLEDYPCLDPASLTPGSEYLDDTFLATFIDLVVDAVDAMCGYGIDSSGQAVLPEVE